MIGISELSDLYTEIGLTFVGVSSVLLHHLDLMSFKGAVIASCGCLCVIYLLPLL